MREVMSLQGSLSIERMCDLTRVSRASFYRSFQEKQPVEEEMEVRSAIQEIAVEHRRRYGYRRISAELRRRGMCVNHKRVMRIMAEDNLLAVRTRAFVVTTNSGHEFEIHLNLAGRMKLTGINQLWVADITYIRLKRGVCVFSRGARRLFAESGGLGAGQNVGGAIGAGSAEPCSYGKKTRTRLGAPFGSWSAVRVHRIRRRATPTPDDPQHESTCKSLRQCQLRELHENIETGGNLREPVRRPWA
jgi:hypothetical protein